MKTGMTIQELLTEVQRQHEAKRDYLAGTKEHIRMVRMDDYPQGVALVLLSGDANALERFEITEHCHRQIATRLNIPFKYYERLLNDHRDMVLYNVNELFEREPEMRMIRTLDGKARAFLSNRYHRIDNDFVLSHVLPPLVKGEIEARPLSAHVSDNKMNLKVLFTDDRLAQEIGTTRTGKPDIVRPGISIANSETGMGSFVVEGFTFRDFCLNGCVFGKNGLFSYRRTHLGSKLIASDESHLLFSEDTMRKQDAATLAEVSDLFKRASSVEFAQQMGDRLRALKNGDTVQNPRAAIDEAARVIGLRDSEKDAVLENLIRDQDYSRWGLLNAVTAVANRDEVTYERATELESAGWDIAELNNAMWRRIAQAEVVAA